MYDDSRDEPVFDLKYDPQDDKYYVTPGARNYIWSQDSLTDVIKRAGYKNELQSVRPAQYHMEILGGILSNKKSIPSNLKEIAIKMYGYKGENPTEQMQIRDLSEHLYKQAEILENILQDTTDNSVSVKSLKKLIRGMSSSDRINLDIFKLLGQTSE